MQIIGRGYLTGLVKGGKEEQLVHKFIRKYFLKQCIFV